jgi:hypothetical protein
MRVLFVSLMALLAGVLPLRAQTIAGRYLYVVGCGASVDKLDTIAERKIGTFDLAQRTGRTHPIPSGTGTLDGCLANQAVYDVKTSLFYTVVPVEAAAKPDGSKDYRALAFSIPNLKLVENIPAGTNLDDPPRLEIGSGNRVKVVDASAWTPQTSLDLSGFAPDRKQIPNQVLEQSGGYVLVLLFTADANEPVAAVASVRTKMVVRLQDIPSAVPANMHLVPGGTDVLIEETTANGAQPEKTGRLSLYDALTGRRIRDLSDPHIKELSFLAVSPSGKAIYHKNENYRFISLGTAFGTDEVRRPIPVDYPGLVFANK